MQSPFPTVYIVNEMMSPGILHAKLLMVVEGGTALVRFDREGQHPEKYLVLDKHSWYRTYRQALERLKRS